MKILAETKHWVAVDKTAGVNVEQLWDYPSIEQQLKEVITQRERRVPYIGVVHRLDRPVSGVLLMAKKKSTLKGLNEQFAQRKVQKTYIALVEGTLEKKQGALVHYLEKKQKEKRAVAYLKPRKNAIRAELFYKVIEESTTHTQLEIKPITGKFHQIRVQLAAIGHPIVNDAKYGAEAITDTIAIALHAHALSFSDPQTEEVTVVVAKELPAIFNL